MHTLGFDISALDPSFKAHAARGIGRYVRELDRYLSNKKDLPFQMVRFDHSDLAKGPLDTLASFLPLGRQTFKQQVVYPRALKKGNLSNVKMIHFPAHMDAPSRGEVPTVVTILDLIPLVFSELYKAPHRNLRFKFGRALEVAAMKRAQFIFAISENTARDVERILSIPRERIHVTPLGVDPSFQEIHPLRRDEESLVRSRLGIPSERPVVLYVGGIDQRKNPAALVKVAKQLAKLQQEKRRALPLFIIAGRVKEDAEFPKLEALIRSEGADDLIHFTGFVSDNDLRTLYGISSAFYFPSLYEGFGLTPLEALAAGVPVVSSNTSSMPEVLNDAAILLDPTDEVGAVRALASILNGEVDIVDLIGRGRERASHFSWERTGEETVKGYEKALRLLAA